MNKETLIPYTLFCHSTKESMYDDGCALGLEGKELHNFMYSGYEITLEGNVHTESGTFFVEKVNGSRLEKQIEV